ncbi:hypothetical protein EVAR_89769_1 [Eumeta japonica]|uniref:Uncharacterized protein n=1 Tax=Eumeta variegata TaxID=151549 RepID=A0A4C1XD31_EUMVA|nr:hypothetical protein EVAR_89769_1 [Eumeta japonica]
MRNYTASRSCHLIVEFRSVSVDNTFFGRRAAGGRAIASDRAPSYGVAVKPTVKLYRKCVPESPDNLSRSDFAPTFRTDNGVDKILSRNYPRQAVASRPAPARAHVNVSTQAAVNHSGGTRSKFTAARVSRCVIVNFN